MKNDIVQILYVAPNAGISKKTGNAYDMRMAQCIVEIVNEETGAPEPLIGEMLLPEKFKDIPPGRYQVVYCPGVTREKRVEGRVGEMIPVAGQAVRPVAAPAAPAASAKA